MRQLPTGNTGSFIRSLDFGGAERVAATIAYNWPECQGEHILLTGYPVHHGAPEIPEAHLLGDVLRRLPVATTYREIPRLALLLRREILRSDIRTLIVHAASIRHAHILLSLRALGVIKPNIVAVIHTSVSDRLPALYGTRSRQRRAVRVMGWLLGRAAAVVGVSHAVARDLEQLLGWEEGSVHAITNPVAQDFIRDNIGRAVDSSLSHTFEALPRPLLITSGRLVEAKAHDDLIRAFALTRAGSLVILGDGPLREDLAALARRLGVAERVWMPGVVENPWWFMARSDMFVLSSRHEGFALVIVEALACGVPVVSTDCPSGPAEILEGVPGCKLVPVGDPEALSVAIGATLEGPSENIVTDLGKYDPAYVAKQYAEVAAGVMAETPRPRRRRRAKRPSA